MTAPIVVGVADSDTARRAAFAAAQLAVDLGAPLHLVVSVKDTRPDETTISVGSDRLPVTWKSGAEKFLAALEAELPGSEITHAIVLEEPATALCDEAERLGARMIVVGNRRVQGLSRVLGAVATDVARRATCDVLISHTISD